jgi:hypothetical protein
MLVAVLCKAFFYIMSHDRSLQKLYVVGIDVFTLLMGKKKTQSQSLLICLIPCDRKNARLWAQVRSVTKALLFFLYDAVKDQCCQIMKQTQVFVLRHFSLFFAKILKAYLVNGNKKVSPKSLGSWICLVWKHSPGRFQQALWNSIPTHHRWWLSDSFSLLAGCIANVVLMLGLAIWGDAYNAQRKIQETLSSSFVTSIR